MTAEKGGKTGNGDRAVGGLNFEPYLFFDKAIWNARLPHKHKTYLCTTIKVAINTFLCLYNYKIALVGALSKLGPFEIVVSTVTFLPDVSIMS